MYGTIAYDFEDAQRYLDDFENQLERRNPGAGATVEQHLQDVTIAEIGNILQDTVPKIIAKTYDPAASSGVIDAQIEDIVVAMERAAGHQNATSGRSRSSNASGSQDGQ